jgi:tetratricopeptide (TPR) repeat protein
MVSANRGGSLIGKIGSYLQIVAKDPSSTAFVPLAEAYRQIGLLDDALEAARLGTKMLPHFSPGYSTMGRILGQMGRIDEAMSAYARALSIDQQSQSALVGLARLHLTRGERDQARRILKQAEEFHPDDEKIADMLIALDLPRPWAEIKLAPQISPSIIQEKIPSVEIREPIPTATLAEIYVKQGLLDQAVKVYQEILKLHPDNVAVHDRMTQLVKLSMSAEVGLNDGPSLALDPAINVQTTAVMERPSTSLATSPEQGALNDQSLLSVFKRWLTAINQGRANV